VFGNVCKNKIFADLQNREVCFCICANWKVKERGIGDVGAKGNSEQISSTSSAICLIIYSQDSINFLLVDAVFL
jgi:hypothetical protein